MQSIPTLKDGKKAREISEERGNFVKSIISRFINCEGLNILELGSGEGGQLQYFQRKINLSALI